MSKTEPVDARNNGDQPIRVRSATLEDIPSILAIYNEAVLTTTATYDYEPRSLEHRIIWYEDHQAAGLPMFVAVNSRREITGWSALNRYHDRPGFRFTSEDSIYVHTDHRGQGVGGELLRPLLKKASELGLRAIMAGIDAQNIASLRLHSRHGFVEVGRFPNVGYKFGRWLDVVYMQHTLPESGVRL